MKEKITIIKQHLNFKELPKDIKKNIIENEAYSMVITFDEGVYTKIWEKNYVKTYSKDYDAVYTKIWSKVWTKDYDAVYTKIWEKNYVKA